MADHQNLSIAAFTSFKTSFNEYAPAITRFLESKRDEIELNPRFQIGVSRWEKFKRDGAVLISWCAELLLNDDERETLNDLKRNLITAAREVSKNNLEFCISYIRAALSLLTTLMESLPMSKSSSKNELVLILF
jgi:hypothetical protein